MERNSNLKGQLEGTDFQRTANAIELVSSNFIKTFQQPQMVSWKEFIFFIPRHKQMLDMI